MAHRVSIEVFFDYPHLGERDFGGTGRPTWTIEASDREGLSFLKLLEENLRNIGRISVRRSGWSLIIS